LVYNIFEIFLGLRILYYYGWRDGVGVGREDANDEVNNYYICD
jgi:hypothetical protein